MVDHSDAPLLADTAVLAAVPGATVRTDLSAFELAVLTALDGAQSNAMVAATLGLGAGDLRIALIPLLQKGLVTAPVVRPALQLVPGRRAPSPQSDKRPIPAPTVAHDQRHAAASRQAQALRLLRRGDFVQARAEAEAAAALAPGVADHQDVLARWDAHVVAHLGADLEGKPRVDAARQWVAVAPDSAGGWTLLATLLAPHDPPVALRAAIRAKHLAPTPERARLVRECERLVARGEKARSFGR